MKDIRNALLSWLKSHKRIVIVCQILLLSTVIGMIVINSKKIENISGREVQLHSGKITKAGEAYIDAKDPYAELFAQADFHHVKRGFYLIRINYETGYNDNGVYITTDNPDYGNINTDIGDKEKTVQLKSYHSEITIHAWLKEEADTLSANFHYCGGGYLGIRSVQLVQVPDYTGAIILLVIMILTDVFLYKKECLFEESKKKEKRIIISGLFLIVILACLPLMNDFLVFNNDLNFHLSRIEGIREGLLSGQFPVKIEPQKWNEYGYGAPFFYPDLLLYFPAILTLLGYGLQTAYKCYVVAITALTAFLAYFSFARILKNKYLGLAGSFLYTLALYRLADVYERSMLGAFSAYAFFPLVILGLFKIYEKSIWHDSHSGKERNRGWIILALGLTGCLQTHVLSCEMVGIFMLIFFLVFIRYTLRKEVMVPLLKSLVLVILLNVWFLVPFLQVFKGDYVVNKSDYFVFMIQNNGAFVSQIFDLLIHGLQGTVTAAKGTPVEVGQSVGLSLGLGMLFFLFFVYVEQDEIRKHAELKKESHLGILFCALGLIAVFMATTSFPYDWLYRKSTFLKYLICHIQFPWRFINIATPLFVLTTLIAASLIWKLLGKHRTETFLSVILCITLISMGNFYFMIMEQETNYYRCQDYQADSIIEATSDYLLNSTATDKLDNLVKTSDQGVILKKYNKTYTNVELTCQNNGEKEGYIEVPLFLYPCYQAKDMYTGRIMDLTYGDNNTIRIAIPPSYSGTIHLYVHERFLWRMAEIVSLSSYIGLAALLLYRSGKCKFSSDEEYDKKEEEKQNL